MRIATAQSRDKFKEGKAATSPKEHKLENFTETTVSHRKQSSKSSRKVNECPRNICPWFICETLPSNEASLCFQTCNMAFVYLAWWPKFGVHRSKWSPAIVFNDSDHKKLCNWTKKLVLLPNLTICIFRRFTGDLNIRTNLNLENVVSIGLYVLMQ